MNGFIRSRQQNKGNSMLAEVIHGATPLENDLVGVHPRLYARLEDFERLRAVIGQEGYAPIWAGVQA